MNVQQIIEALGAESTWRSLAQARADAARDLIHRNRLVEAALAAIGQRHDRHGYSLGG